MGTISASAVWDGIEDVLTSASMWSTSEVSKSDYNILAKIPGACALVIRFRGLTNEPITYGNPRGKFATWIFEVEGYVKAYGNPNKVFENQIQLVDHVVNTINADDTLSDSAKSAVLERVDTQAGFVLQIAGFRWLPATFRIRAEQF